MTKVIFSAICGFLAAPAAASSIITYLTPGVGVNSLPIGAVRTTGDLISEVYAGSQFGNSPVTIYSIAFSSAAPTGGTDATQLSGAANLMLSTSAFTPAAPGSTPGADAQTVFSGTFSDAVLHNSTFDIVFALTTPFTYDPSAGNLLLNFTWTAPAATNGLINISGSYSTPLVGSSSSTSQYGAFSSPDVGVATQFSLVPEPGTLALAAGALLAALSGRRWWRRGLPDLRG